MAFPEPQNYRELEGVRKGQGMEELFQKWIDEAPATAIALYILWCWQTWGKETLGIVRDIKNLLEQTREERRLSEAAQAKSPHPWRGDTR